MFNFMVKYLGFLKHVPLLAQAFDGQLLFWTLVSGSEIPGCIDEIESAVSGWRGAFVTRHKYGGVQFNFNDSELGHIHSNGILDIRFSKNLKQLLLNQGRISHHHVFANSGWISFYIRSKEDVEYAKWLLRIAYEWSANPHSDLLTREEILNQAFIKK